MQLTVSYFSEGTDGEELLIRISYRKKVLYSEKINLIGKTLDEITEAKKNIIKTFCEQHSEIDFKDVLLAFSQVDEHMRSYYQKLYPRGGYRGGGRPKGTKTEKTVRFNRAVTPEECSYLIKCLEEYRKKH